MKITAYISSNCAWSGGVCAVLEKLGLEFDKLDITTDPKAYAEMTRKSGQINTPCVEIDGVMLADVSGQEVEDYLISNELVGNADRKRGERMVGESMTNRSRIPGAFVEEQTRFF